MIPTTLQEDAEKFAAFILENYPDSKQWDQPVMKAAWYISHAFAATVCCEHGHIVALLAARPVERPGLGVLPFYFNEGGTCLHVDLWCDVSGDDRARQALKMFALMRYPGCKTITMFRHYETNLRVYTLSKFWKSFDKITRVKRKKKEKQHETVSPI